MNKGIIIGIIVVLVIAISFGAFVTSNNAFQPTETDENLIETEVSTPKSYSVKLSEGIGVGTGIP